MRFIPNLGNECIIVIPISQIFFKCAIIEMKGDHVQIIVGGIDVELEKASDISLKIECTDAARLID